MFERNNIRKEIDEMREGLHTEVKNTIDTLKDEIQKTTDALRKEVSQNTNDIKESIGSIVNHDKEDQDITVDPDKKEVVQKEVDTPEKTEGRPEVNIWGIGNYTVEKREEDGGLAIRCSSHFGIHDEIFMNEKESGVYELTTDRSTDDLFRYFIEEHDDTVENEDVKIILGKEHRDSPRRVRWNDVEIEFEESVGEDGFVGYIKAPSVERINEALQHVAIRSDDAAWNE